MNKTISYAVFSVFLLISIHFAYAEELPLPEGKNIKEWESITAALISEKRYNEAMIYVDKILNEDTNNVKALSNKSGLLLQLEKYEESLAISNQLLEKDPEKISILSNKAIALKMLEKYEESFIVFSKILYIDPNNEQVQKSRAKLLSGTPTISTSETNYKVHILVTAKNDDGQLIAVMESTNARILSSVFTEKWWEEHNKNGEISHVNEIEIYQIENKMIPTDDYLGMVTMQREMEGYKINIFEAFMPLMQVEETDQLRIQWTISKT